MRFLSHGAAPPRPADPKAAEIGLERWRDLASARPEQAEFIELVEADPAGRALLESIFGNSPYLSRLVLSETDFLRDFATRGADAAMAGLLARLKTELAAVAERSELAAKLRRAKRQAALCVALADIAGLWPLEKVTGALSDFADAVLELCVAHLMGRAVADGLLASEAGYFALGLGKLGAHELNYSSDVDLIVLFDPERMHYTGPRSLQELMVQITRDLVRLMEEATAEGYVFRCDLRLRPDPGATPLAVSMRAAEIYYEGMGQNWERAAMIKARVVAGDKSAGDEFLKILVPFIWRKHLDFAAIADIHSIKRQIYAHHGGGEIAVLAHNLKLGRGGIREIEFFAQTQQLIWGGRIPELRMSGTVAAIAALAEAGRVTAEAAAEMTAAYRFLRATEHRLQMIDDQQTHTLPEDEAGLARFAVFMGYETSAAFTAELLKHLRNVERHYAALFEEAPTLSGPGNLVFTGTEHDPETLKTLEGLGFSDPAAVSAAIMSWHRGRYPATRSARARELLTELVPAILAALGRTASPQAAFMKFDEFLGRLPAGVQLFSLFLANPALLNVVADVMGDAPLLADLLARRPILMDGVLSAGFYESLPAPAALAAELGAAVSRAQSFEAVLDVARRWTADKKFRIGVQLLRDLIPADEAARNFADIADAAIRVLKPAVEAEFAKDHGAAPGGMAVMAMGRLGGREMTLGSDLDLIYIYDFPEGVELSSGPRPLSPHEYFARLSRRLINAISAQTAEGQLYAVDMRLRPSGTSGPIASHIAAFRHYHEKQAWTWEHLALTRARVIAGPEQLAAEIQDVVREALTRRRNPGRLARDVLDMRLKMAEAYKAHSLLEVKHLRGGFVDADFVVQFLQLRHAHLHPDILDTNTRKALARIAGFGLIAAPAAHALDDALLLWQRVLGILRLCYPEPLPQPLNEEVAPEGLRRLLVRATGTADYAALLAEIKRRAADVRTIFDELIVGMASPPEESERDKERETKA